MTVTRRSLMPILFGAATLIGASAAGAIAVAPQFYRVTGIASWDSLNMRAGPAPSYQIVGRIPHDGIYVENLGNCVGAWCRMRYSGMIGWVHTDYLTAQWSDYPPTVSYRVVGVAWNDVLNIRTGPSAHYPAIGAIAADGTGIVPAGGCEGAWCRIRHGDTYGWVHTR